MTRIVVLGDLNVDVVAVQETSLAHGSDTAAHVSLQPGGGGANVAAWLAKLGVEAIAKKVRDNVDPEVTPGLDFYDTGVALVTDKPVEGVESITTAEAEKICWG